MASQDQNNQGDITDSSVQFVQSGRDAKVVQGDDRSFTIIFNQTFSQSTRTCILAIADSCQDARGCDHAARFYAE
ncbi:hypothetical protein ACQ4M3_40815 [Leptolyngbya sp. AN03gr2]|uniref:hypothetical protein n=1 Tax=unclassified Leptolyngbya TaxID=2650499 RepID=UPI003D319949